MRTSISDTPVRAPSHGRKANLPARGGQTAVAWATIAALGLGLSACDPQKPAQGVIGYVAGFAGFVSADEPRAALVGENVLSAGGTAADAAVAMAATLTVTLPSRAGWLGGGVCLSRNPKDKSVQVYSFLPEALPGGGFAPGLPRGLYALHAASGTLRWEQILTPAENMARFGLPVSRALARDLESLGSPVGLEAEMRAVYAPGGRLLREGDNLVQARTASALTALRIKGAGDAYAGGLAQVIAEANPEQAGARRAALRDYAAKRLDPVTAKVDNETAFFPPAPFGGAAAAPAWSRAAEAKNPQAARAVPAAPAGSGATGFVAVDRGGMAVTCALSMGQMFGGGHADGATGMLAYSPLDGSADALAMLPMIVSNHHVHDLRVAAAGAGATAAADVLDVAVRGRILAANGIDASAAAAKAGEATSRVTGVICPDGAPANVGNCTLAIDPRGAGLSRSVGIESADRSGIRGLIP